jgi:hypothetical protein
MEDGANSPKANSNAVLKLSQLLTAYGDAVVSVQTYKNVVYL